MFPQQEHTVQTHEGLYFVKAKKREIIPLIADVMDFYYIYINRMVLLDILPNQDMVESQEKSEWLKLANIQSQDKLNIQIHYSKQLTAFAIDLKLTRIDLETMAGNALYSYYFYQHYHGKTANIAHEKESLETYIKRTHHYYQEYDHMISLNPVHEHNVNR